MRKSTHLLAVVILFGLGGVSATAAYSAEGVSSARLGRDRPAVRSSPARSTRLYVRTIPSGARIKLDGKPRGTSDRLFKVPPGVRKMTVEVELDGHYPEQQVVEIRGGRITRVELELEERPKFEESREEVSSAGAAQTATFDFDFGPGPYFSTFNEGDLWTLDTDGPSLRISKPADDGTFRTTDFVSAGVESRFLVDGDFVITVDFALHDFPFPTAELQRVNEALLSVLPKAGGDFSVLRFNQSRGRSWIEIFAEPYPKNGYGLRRSNLTRGRYRITRSGETTTGLFAAAGSSEFTPIADSSGCSGPVRVKLGAAQGMNSGTRARTALDISFDNLVIEADRIEGLVPAEGAVKSTGGQAPEKAAEVVPSAAEVRRFEGHTDKIYDVAFSPDGRLAASGSADRTVRLWDVETGREVHRLGGFDDRVDSVEFTPDAKYVVSGSSDATVRLWDVAGGKQVRRYEGHEDHVRSVAVSQDGRFVLSGGEDRTLRLWDLATGDQLKRIELDWPTFDVAISPDNKLALTADPVAGVARLWDLESGAQIRQFKHHPRVTRVAFSPDGRHVFSAGGHRGGGFEIGRSGPYVYGSFDGPGSGALGGSDNGIRLWELATGREIRRFEGHTRSVWKTAISPDGSRILSASPDRTIRLWDVTTGKELCRMEGCASDGVAFSPDGHLALGVLIDMKTICLWKLPGSAKSTKRSDRDDRSAVAALRKLGAKLEVDDEGSVIRVRQLSTDEGMAHLRGLPKLRELHVEGVIYEMITGTVKGAYGTGTTVTDAGLAHLRKVPQLETLYIGSEFITDAGLVHLEGLVALDTLTLSVGASLTDAGLVHLKGLTNLETLDLQENRITGTGLAHLKGLTKLRQLVLSRTDVTDAALAHLEGLTELRSLELDWCHVTDAGLAHLRALPKLRWLSLGWTKLTDAGLAHLGALPRLESLSLEDTKITDVGLKHLEALTGLRELYVTGTQVTDAGLQHLKGLSRLEYVSLHETQVTEAGAKDLVKALPQCEIGPFVGESPAELSEEAKSNEAKAIKALRSLGAKLKLDYRGEVVEVRRLSTDEGMAHLRGLPKLREIHIEGVMLVGRTGPYAGVGYGSSQVTDSGLARLEGLSQLEALQIRDAKITDAGLAHLKPLRKLEALSIGPVSTGGFGTGRLNVTDAGLVHLKALRGLESLDLRGTQITDAGLAHLQGLTSLRRLHLPGANLTEKGIRNLRRALPDCQIEVADD